jgi:ABC-type dipeptide/oligopeptide/nickel transport system permease subunit
LTANSRQRSFGGDQLAIAAPTLAFAPVTRAMPGMAILLTTLAFTISGDGVRDAVDPRQRSTARGATET